MFNKRVLKKATDDLDKVKKPAKSKDIIYDPAGQWRHPGVPTRIPSNTITMEGVDYPVLGIPNYGEPKVMMPGQYYEFPEADYVDEYPQMQDGGQIYTYAKRPGSYYKKDSKGNWMIKNESTHGKYVAIDDPKGTRSKVLNAQARPLQSAPKAKPQSQYDNVVYDSTLQPVESTAVRNLIEKPMPDVIGKDVMTYLKEKKQKKEKAISKNIRAKNEKVKQFYKEYHESPRYIEMLSKSSPDKYEDYAAGRMINLEGYNDLNISKPHLYIRHKQPKDQPNTGGFSVTDSGDITVLPKGFGVKGLLPHEWSHSSDRPIFLGLNPFTGKKFKIPLFDRLIPEKDVQWITKNKPKTWFDSPEFKSITPEIKKFYKQYPDWAADAEEFMSYVGEPTETRARLNDIRFQAKQKGIYDPFTEKVTPATFKKLLKTKFESGSKESFDALQQLRDVYTDEEIQWMLNNISKNQQAEEEGAQSFGRYGGQFQEGGEQGCPEGYAFNPKTGECIEWNPDIRESYDQPTSFDPVGDVIYMNPNDRPEGMSDEEYAQMYQDQLEHEQLHRLQWKNDELKGESKTPLRMPSTVDNEDFGGDHYYNRRGEEVNYLHDYWKNHHPDEAAFIPDDVIYNYETDPAMYQLPWTVEGEARGYEYATHDGMESLFPKRAYGGVPQYAPGGSAGCPPGSYWNGKECVKVPKGAKVITDPKEYAYRKAMYEDSASLYNAYQFQKKNLDPTVTLTDFVKSYNNATKLLYDGKRPKMTVEQIKKIRNTNFNKNIPRVSKNDYKEVKANPRGDYDPMDKNTGDYKVYDYYKKLKFNHPVAIGQYSSPDVYHSKILPTRNYFDGVAYSPVYAKPKQPVVFGNEPSEEIIKIPLPPNTIQVGEKEVLNLDEKTGIVTRIIEPIYEKIPENKTPEPPVKKEDIIVKQAVPTSSQITESQYIEEGVPDTTVGMEWVNKPERYIDWQGTSIGYRLPRFRKPGHGGDLIKKGKQRYIHLPTIETRNTAELVPEEEEYRRGGIIPKYLKMPKNYGKAKYSSNISATNKVFARNILFRNEKNKIYDPNARYQDGGIPEDYSQFQSFAETLPSNLQDPDFEYGNPDQYNLYGMWETVGKPQSFQDVQDSDYFPLQEDNTYHGFTVGSDGEFLKPMSHGTTWKEVMNAHLNTDPFFQQNRIIKNEKGRLQYVPNEDEEYIETELSPEEIQEYAKGGYIVEDISIPLLNQKQDGGENNFYKVKGSKGVYRKVNGNWEVDWNKSGNFQPLSKGDVKKRSEQLNKNAELLFDPNYSDLISSQNLEYKAAPKEELKKKLTSGQTAAQKVFAKDFNISDRDRLGKLEDKIEKGVADYVKYHNENFDRPLTQQDIDNARETISNNIMASEGVYDPSAGKFNRNASTIANEDSEYIMKTDFPENASFGNYAQRGWEYLTNPFTAAEYIVSGGGAGNMPFNINELRMAGIDPGVVEGRNIVGNTLNTTTNLFDAGDKAIRNTLAGNYGTAVLEAMRFLPVAGYADDLTKFIGRNVDDVARLAKKSKTPLQNIAENVETVNDVISSTPGVPRPPLPNSELILNRFNQLLNEGDSALVARAAIADEFGIDAINVLNNTPPIPSQPIYTGSIDLRRPTSNQLPDIPETLNIPIEQTGVRPVTQLENDVQQMLQETALNLNHPEYQIPNSFDDFISSLRGRRYSTQDVEQLANNPRYRDYYNSIRARQQASLSPELNDLFSDPSTYLRGEQNINIRPNVDYADKINRIAQGILYPETLTQLNTLNVTGKAKSAAKTLGKKLSDFKSNLNTAINKANVKLGEVIDKSKIETLKKPINSKDIDNEVNKYLAEGLGIKKGDVQIKVKTKPDGTTQVLIKPKEFFKKNKQLIEDTYGKGSFDEWINTVSDDWIDSGYLGLKSTSGERVQPRKLTEILSGKKLESSVDFGYGVMNVPTPGLKRAGDFPFANWEGGFRENLLENLGVSGELTQAYNKALKGKGYGIYSGGTGHLTPGAKRYVRELLNNRVEVMNPDRAEDLYRLLNDESTMKAVNNALKNKNEPLPASVYQAIQPLVFKYKRKGGSINNDFIESELSQKEIDKLVAQGYIVETVD